MSRSERSPFAARGRRCGIDRILNVRRIIRRTGGRAERSDVKRRGTEMRVCVTDKNNRCSIGSSNIATYDHSAGTWT